MTNVQLMSCDRLYRDCNCHVSQILTLHLHLFLISKTPINNPSTCIKPVQVYASLYLFRQDLLYP